MRVTFLGTGTSGGIPIIGCTCEVCLSTDRKDRRLRTAGMIEVDEKVIVIDAGPDFRYQMLRAKVKTIDALLITHGHRDHIAGLDDIRPFNYLQHKVLDLYCDSYAEQMIREQYSYAFDNKDYDAAPRVNFIRVNKEPFAIGSTNIIPIEVMHHKLPIRAYRIGDLTYITDAKTISEPERQKIRGTKLLVVNALRHSDHNAHFTLEEALTFIDEIKPEQAYLTHLSHQFGCHEEMERKLPSNVKIAYDGLVLEL